MRFSTVAIFFLSLCTASLAVPFPAEAAKLAPVKAPTVELVSPMRVKVGGTIVLRGRNFSSRRVRNTVVFRGRRTVLASRWPPGRTGSWSRCQPASTSSSPRGTARRSPPACACRF